MIQITLRQALEAQQALQDLGRVSLPVKLGWKIGRVTNAIQTELGQFNEARDAIILRDGVKQENGNYQMPPEKMADFNQQINDLLKEEIEISITPIKIEELGEKEIPASVFADADWLFEGEAPIEEAAVKGGKA